MTEDDGLGLPTELIDAALSTPAVQEFIDLKLRGAVADALRDAMPLIVESSKEALRSEIQPALDAIARGRASEGASPPVEGASPSGGGLAGLSMPDIVQMIGMFKGGGGGGGGGTEAAMAQVSTMAEMMGQISHSVTKPMFEHYNMGFSHALASFGHYTRATPEDREAFSASMPMAQPAPARPAPSADQSSDAEVRRQMGAK